MNKLSFTFLSLFSCIIFSQNFNPKTLILPETPTHEDFSFLKEELKDVQILMLGEKSHYDANVFEMKVKIAQYLNQEMEFNTIAFESGVYDVYKATQEINKGTEASEALKKSLFFFWSKTKEAKLLSKFIKESNIKLFGFDNQITGKYGSNYLVEDLYDYCYKNKLKLNLNKPDFELLIESINSYTFDEADISYQKFENELQNLLSQISLLKENNSNFHWNQIVKSIITYGKDAYQKSDFISSYHCTRDDNIRDKQMANNLLAYLKKHPNEKVICWGANAHFINDMNSIGTAVVKEFKPMGSYIKKELKDKTYSLATVTAEDSINLAGKWEKTPIEKGSFEDYLKQTNYSLAFISSNQDEMKKEQQNRLFSPITFIPSRLDQIHDGYLYFNKTTPLTFLYEQDKDEEKKSAEIDELTKTITGKFIDQDTKETIPFVQVILEGTTKGTMADTKGKYQLKYTSTKQKVIISAMGYAEKTISISELPKNIYLKEESTALDEVILFGKISPYTVIENAIKNKKKNYATKGYNLMHYTDINFKANDSSYLHFEFVSKQYNRGITKVYRPTQSIQEINWLSKQSNTAKNIHQFLFYEVDLTKTNNASFLSKRKFKKFHFEIEKVISYKGDDTYVINFSINRNHWNYTTKNYPCIYSGQLYITKNSYALVKAVENWEIMHYPEYLKTEYGLTHWPKKIKEINRTLETRTTNYSKNSDGLYYKTNSKLTSDGTLLDKDDTIVAYSETINSVWYDFNTTEVTPISFKEEVDMEKFKNATYNVDFWNNYKRPKLMPRKKSALKKSTL
jgi:erythromycin esterase-like protein